MEWGGQPPLFEMENGYHMLKSAIPIEVIGQTLSNAKRDAEDLTLGPRDQPNGCRAVIHDYLPIVDAVERALRQAGYRPQRLNQVSVFTQSADGVRRYWHVDAREENNDILALCYLQDTAEANGCLIVGERNPRFQEAADNYEVGPIEGETLVPAQMGDLIVLKPQQPHAAARNSTEEVRLLIRLWITLADSQTKN